MYNNILIIAPAEGFLIKGLQTKLKGIGLDSLFSAPKIKDLEFKFRNTDLVLIFTDDTFEEKADVLVYIKDRCNEFDEQIIVIGTEDEYNSLTNFIPTSLVYDFFKRPLDMEKLLDEMERFMASGAQNARRKSILIVDDDVSYMSMIMEWLKDQYRVSLANSGVQAITWLAKNHADLVLLDYEMPVTTGPQVLEMIRSDPDLTNIPVMFLTGRGDKESIMRVLSLKPVGYQLKTVDRKTLRENIAAYFSSEKAKI